MPGVMDIKHILCHPCEPYSPTTGVPLYFESSKFHWSPPPTPMTDGPYSHDSMASKSPISTCSTSTSTSTSTTNSQCSSTGDRLSPLLLLSPHSDMDRRPSDRKRAMSEVSPPLGYTPAKQRSRSASTGQTQTRTPWTPFEDKLLVQGYDQGLSWAMISHRYLPHRSRGCCWGRYKTLQARNLIETKPNARMFKRPWKAVVHKSFK